MPSCLANYKPQIQASSTSSKLSTPHTLLNYKNHTDRSSLKTIDATTLLLQICKQRIEHTLTLSKQATPPS